MTFGALRVVAELRAPVVGDTPVHLDALLMEVAYRRLPHSRDVSRSTPEGEIAELPIPVWRLRCGGHEVPMASAMLLPGPARRVSVPVVRRKDGEDLEHLRSAWTPGSGPGRNLLMRRQAVVSARAEFLAWGNRREVRKALELIHSLGSKRASGNGHVESWTVEDAPGLAPADCLVRAGRAVRHLPVDWLADMEGVSEWGAYRSPYWHAARHGHVCPAGRRARLRVEVIEALDAVAGSS